MEYSNIWIDEARFIRAFDTSAKIDTSLIRFVHASLHAHMEKLTLAALGNLEVNVAQVKVPTQQRQPGDKGFETVRFANQRKKNRKANKQARAQRRKNR